MQFVYQDNSFKTTSHFLLPMQLLAIVFIYPYFLSLLSKRAFLMS